MTDMPSRPKLRLQHRVGRLARGERLRVDRIGNHRDLRRRDAARDDVVAQAFADRRHVIGASQRVGLEAPCQPIPQTVLARSAVIDGCVFPERAHLVHDGDAELAADAKRGDGVQHRRMRVQDVRANLAGNFLEPPLDAPHQQQLGDAGDARRGCGAGRAEEMPAVDVLLGGRRLRGVSASSGETFPSRARAARAGSTASETYTRCAAVSSDRARGECECFMRRFAAPRRRCGRRPRIRGWIAHHVAQERLEHQQRPQRRAVVARARLVLLDEVPQVASIEPAGRGKRSARAPRRARAACSGPRNQRASGTAKPIFGRYRISLRQARLHRLLQQVLAFLAAHLQATRAGSPATRPADGPSAARAPRASAPCWRGRPWC